MKTKVIVIIEGGVVQEVITNHDNVELAVIDKDCEGFEEDELIDVESVGDECYVYIGEVLTVDKDRCNEVMETIKRFRKTAF